MVAFFYPRDPCALCTICISAEEGESLILDTLCLFRFGKSFLCRSLGSLGDICAILVRSLLVFISLAHSTRCEQGKRIKYCTRCVYFTCKSNKYTRAESVKLTRAKKKNVFSSKNILSNNSAFALPWQLLYIQRFASRTKRTMKMDGNETNQTDGRNVHERFSKWHRSKRQTTRTRKNENENDCTSIEKKRKRETPKKTKKRRKKLLRSTFP